MPSITEQENGFSVRQKLNIVLGLHTNIPTGDYTLLASDHDRMVAINSATDAIVTVPAGLPSDFKCLISQIGVGALTVEGSGAIVNAFNDSRVLPGQYAVAQLFCIGTNNYLLTMMGGSFEEEPPPEIDALTYTSAGVFDSSGLLVRTLWSGVKDHPDALDPAAAWDGTIDDGSVASTGLYTIKRIQHKVLYSWDGAVGNSSPIHTTTTYHAYGSVIRDMAITDAGEMYFTTVYDERIQTCRVMTTADIQNSLTAVPPQNFRQAIIATHGVCTDGTIAYYGLVEGPAASGVIGTNCATKIKVPFSSGTVSGTLTYLGLNTTPGFGGQVVGIAVQKTGSYIFLARPNLGDVEVYNKSTAAFVSTFGSFAHPRRVASNPTTITQLWVGDDTANNGKTDLITKCAVDGAGTITTTATTISVTDALALAISPDGTTLLVADGGTHQVRAYNTSDGSVRSGWGTGGTLGVAGGYVNSPAVTNTKFMFYAVIDMGSQGPQAFLAYQPDGKLWIGDVGNCRYLRFSAGESPAFVDYFSYLPGFYPCRVCKNDPTRVFATFLEFEINYSLPLSPTNGSWVLKNNWAGNLIDYPGSTPLQTALYNAMKNVGTYSNGRTYATVDLPTIAARQFFELTSTGLRSTGWNVIPQLYINYDMDAIFASGAGEGSECTITRNAFMGFDASNNPSWAVHDAVPGNTTALFGEEVLLTSATLPTGFVRTHAYDNNFVKNVERLANGVYPFSDPNSGDGYGSTHNHFGGIDGTTGQVKFNTAPLTSTRTGGLGNYFLLYPPAPYFPYNQGNGGADMLFMPGHEHVFIPFNGEEWGNNQTNVITHWHESGLALRTFGVAAPYFGAWSLRKPDLIAGDNIPADDPYSFLGYPGLAGNCRWGGIAFVNDKYYLYQNDEWYHGGITRWTVDNLASIFITEIPVTWDSGTYSPVSDPTDMLEGLTHDAVLVEGDSGWHRSAAEDGFNFHAFTGAINNDHRHTDISLQAKFYSDDVLRGISRDLIRSGSGNWTLEGDVFMYPGLGHGDPFVGGKILFDVLDNTGKVILRWYSYTAGNDAFPGTGGTIKVNGTDLFAVPSGWISSHSRVYFGAVRPFSIVANVGAGTISFTYDIHNMTVAGVFEVGAAIGSPTTLRLAHDAHDFGGEPVICLTRLKFQ